MTEEWRKVPGYPAYLVSSLGNVKNHTMDRPLKPTPDKDGYLRFSAFLLSGQKKTVKVHRAVALAFLGPAPSSEHHVAHCDGDVTNNVPANLRWATATENNRDKAVHGTQTRGAKQHLARLNDDKVREIRSLAASGESQRLIAKRFGVRKGTVQFVINGKTWKHVA